MNNPEDKQKHSWERRDDETTKAYHAFRAFLKLGIERSSYKLAADLGCGRTNIAKWSARHDWKARAAEWDRHMGRMEQEAMEIAQNRRVQEWESKKEIQSLREIELAGKLIDKANEMLNAPLFGERSLGADGKMRTGPAPKWNMTTTLMYGRMSQQLSDGAFDRVMVKMQEDGFDPLSASPEELRAFVARMGVKLPDA